LLVFLKEATDKTVSEHLKDRLHGFYDTDNERRNLLQSGENSASIDRSLRSGVTDVSELAIAETSPLAYYSATLILHAIAVLGAILVVEINTIFDFVNTFGTTFLSFILPAVFVLLS
jgi:hypothetical protein